MYYLYLSSKTDLSQFTREKQSYSAAKVTTGDSVNARKYTYLYIMKAVKDTKS